MGVTNRSQQARRQLVQRRGWRREIDLAQRLTGVVIGIFLTHTVLHLFGVYYMVTVPSHLSLVMSTSLGFLVFETMIAVSTLWFCHGICHIPVVCRSRWKKMHGTSLAIVLLSAVLSVWYCITLLRISKLHIPIAHALIHSYENGLPSLKQHGMDDFMRQARRLGLTTKE